MSHVFADSRIRLLCHARHICVAHAPPESCSSLYKLFGTTAPRLPGRVPTTKLICSNVLSGASASSASMMLLQCSLASSSFTPRKSLFLSNDCLNFRMCSVWWFLLITIPSGLWFQKTIFRKRCRVKIMVFPFVLFHRDLFFAISCWFFRWWFSTAYLLKLFLLPQRVYTTLFIRCDKPELTRWYLCSLHAGIQMSPDIVVGPWAAVMVVTIPSQKALLMCPYVSFSIKRLFLWWWWCVRCLLITESPKTPHHYRYQI